MVKEVRRMGDSEVLALKIDYELNGRRSIYPTILRGDDGHILVDCGYPGFLPLLEIAATHAGISFSDIAGVVITHPDYDHCGALAEITEKYPRVRVMSSEFDAPYIEGKKAPLRITLGIKRFASLSGGARGFRERMESVKPAKVDRSLRSGEIMPWCGGTEVIATPGHTPGHISLFVHPLKTLITGDALIAAHGKLRVSNPQYATDPDLAKKTAASLLAADAEKYVCYHGGTVTKALDGTLSFGN